MDKYEKELQEIMKKHENIEWTMLGDEDFELVPAEELWEPEINPETGKPLPPTTRPDNEVQLMSEGPGFRLLGDFEKVDNFYRYTGDLQYVQIPDEINGEVLTSYQYMFKDNKTVTAVKSTSDKITNMSNMFEDSTSQYLDVSELETKSITGMSYMFRGASGSHLLLENSTGDKGWLTPSLTNVQQMFKNSEFGYIDVKRLGVINVTRFEEMFYGSKIDRLVGMNYFDSTDKKAINYYAMFENAEIKSPLQLNSIEKKHPDTYFANMFKNAKLISPLDLSSFELEDITRYKREWALEKADASIIHLMELDGIDEGTLLVRDDEQKSNFSTRHNRSYSHQVGWRHVGAGYDEVNSNFEIVVGGKGYIPAPRPIQKIEREEFEEEITYQTEERKNREKRSGDIEFIQKGKNGKKKTTITHIYYQNGLYKQKTSVETIVAPIKEIIEMGTLVEEKRETIEEIYKYKTEYYNDYDANKGEKVVQRGEDGYLKQEVIRRIHDDDFEDIENVGKRDYKASVNEIIAIGMIERTNRVTKDEVLKFPTRSSYSYEYKAKERNEPHVIESGKEGKISRTYQVTTYTDDTPQLWDLITELTKRTEPEREVLIYGLLKGTREEKEENIIKFKVEKRYNKDLLEGEERVVQDGINGLDIRYYNVTTYIQHPTTGKTRTPLKKEIRSKRDYTAAVPYIMEIGIKDTIQSIEDLADERVLPFETVYIDDETLYEGQEEVEQEGKDGKVIERYQILTFADGTTKRHDVAVDETPSVDKVIRRGMKDPVISTTEEEETEVIPYESAVIKTNDLAPGVKKILEEGKNGLIIRTYRVKEYWDGEIKREFISKKIQDAQFELIQLGTSRKILEQVRETETRRIAFETVNEETDELYIGQSRVKVEGQEGLIQEIYVKTVFEDGGIERVLVGRRQTPVINQIILVGTKRRQTGEDLSNIKPMNNKMKGNWLYLEDGDTSIRATVTTTFRPKWGYL